VTSRDTRQPAGRLLKPRRRASGCSPSEMLTGVTTVRTAGGRLSSVLDSSSAHPQLSRPTRTVALPDPFRVVACQEIIKFLPSWNRAAQMITTQGMRRSPPEEFTVFSLCSFLTAPVVFIVFFFFLKTYALVSRIGNGRTVVG
jgi:hypothetical protein